MLLSIETATHLPNTHSPHDPKWECDAWQLTLCAVPDVDTLTRTDRSSVRRMNVTFYCGVGQRVWSRTNRPPGGAKAGAVKVKRAEWTPRDLGYDRTKWPHADPGWMYAVPPSIGSVLECLCSDASTVDNAADWASWADDLGFFAGGEISAADVRRSQATHAATIEQTEQLRQLLGPCFHTAVYDAPEEGWDWFKDDTIQITRTKETSE